MHTYRFKPFLSVQKRLGLLYVLTQTSLPIVVLTHQNHPPKSGLEPALLSEPHNLGWWRAGSSPDLGGWPKPNDFLHHCRYPAQETELYNNSTSQSRCGCLYRPLAHRAGMCMDRIHSSYGRGQHGLRDTGYVLFKYRDARLTLFSPKYEILI